MRFQRGHKRLKILLRQRGTGWDHSPFSWHVDVADSPSNVERPKHLKAFTTFRYLLRHRVVFRPYADMDVGWIYPWVGLGWVGLDWVGSKIFPFWWVGLGWVYLRKWLFFCKPHDICGLFCRLVSWVGLGPLATGLGWVGSQKMDPRPCLQWRI